MGKQTSKPWFEQGLQFTCTQCGDCCTGEPGFVWVDDEEIARLAAATGETVEEFCRKYVAQVGEDRTLRERDDGACVFYRKGLGCIVYADRPKQCRTWPFWESNIRSKKAWERTTRTCPGAGQGKLFTAEEILAQSKIIKL